MTVTAQGVCGSVRTAACWRRLALWAGLLLAGCTVVAVWSCGPRVNCRRDQSKMHKDGQSGAHAIVDPGQDSGKAGVVWSKRNLLRPRDWLEVACLPCWQVLRAAAVGTGHALAHLTVVTPPAPITVASYLVPPTAFSLASQVPGYQGRALQPSLHSLTALQPLLTATISSATLRTNVVVRPPQPY